MPTVALAMGLGDRPLVKVVMSYAGPWPQKEGPRTTLFTALLDSGADVTVIAEADWPTNWPLTSHWQHIGGVGGTVPTKGAAEEVEIAIIDRSGTMEAPVLVQPLVAPVEGSILGRDFSRPWEFDSQIYTKGHCVPPCAAFCHPITLETGSVSRLGGSVAPSY